MSQPQTFNVSTPFFAAANSVDSARPDPDYQTSATSAMTNSSVESAVTSNTSYTGFFRHLLSLHKTTICDPVDMTDSYQFMLVILMDCEFVTRILYKHSLLAFLHYFTCVLLFLLLSVNGGMCVLSLLNKDNNDYGQLNLAHGPETKK